MYKRYIKRLLDIIISLVLIVILSPMFLIISFLVLVFMGRPVIFRQKRAGMHNKIFYIFKFRTMTDKKDSQGNLLPENERRTAFGNFLRSTSLDELPELWNILKGEMSFIGPRPLFDFYYPYYTEKEAHRMDVRGGLIPPEVLSLDITPSWDSQLESEAEYAENLTFMTDIKVIFATFVVLFKRMRYNYGDYVRLPLSEERAEKEKINI